jgi:hypothetical protein
MRYLRRCLLVLPAVLIGLIVLSSCAAPPADLNAREGRIFFSVSEVFRNGAEGVEPSLGLGQETEKIYGCCNYSIAASLHRFGGRLNISIEGIEMYDVCLTALGPATRLDLLELEEGVYDLEFMDGPNRCHYILTVTENAFLVADPPGVAPPGFVKPKFRVWWRYPRNSFAVLCGTMEDSAWVNEDFLQKLRAAVGLEEITFPADGELGYPRAPEGHWVDHPARYFAYAAESDFAAAGEVLEAYVRDVIGRMPGVGIWLINWKNQSFRSWMMTGASEAAPSAVSRSSE